MILFHGKSLAKILGKLDSTHQLTKSILCNLFADEIEKR